MALKDSLRARAFGPVPPPVEEKIADLSQADFQLDDQQETNWCWAAVGVSVGRLLGKLVFVDQCQLVLKTLEKRNCAGDCHTNGFCNSSADIVEVLAHQGIVATRHPKGTLDLDTVFAELSPPRKRPVICQVPLDNGLTHFVVIVRANSTRETIRVRDPGKAGDKPFEGVQPFGPFLQDCIEHYLLP